MVENLSRPWRALGVRLSVFPAATWEAPEDLWEQVVGDRPDTEQNQPRAQVRVHTGSWRNRQLQLTASPPSIVWVTWPNSDEEGLPNLEKELVVDVLPEFVAITRPWLASVDFEVKRIGVGLQAVLPAQDRVSAYKMLQELVPSVDMEPETTTDFLYQINRPVPSRVLGSQVRLNRLMKWFALSFKVTPIQVAPQITQAGPALGRDYAGVESDINTPAELVESLDKRLLEAIYDELVELSQKILEYGERA
jgi:hypothetical protein